MAGEEAAEAAVPVPARGARAPALVREAAGLAAATRTFTSRIKKKKNQSSHKLKLLNKNLPSVGCMPADGVFFT